MCQENKQGASKKQGIRRLQATVAGSVTTDRGSNIKWKKIRCAEGFLQEEEMHLDTFVGTQGYETPLDWAFDIYRGSGAVLCLWSARVHCCLLMKVSEVLCSSNSPHSTRFLMGEGKKSSGVQLTGAVFMSTKLNKWERFLWACPHTALCALVVLASMLLTNRMLSGCLVLMDHVCVFLVVGL